MNQKGCSIAQNISGLYDLTVTENGKPLKIIRNISLKTATEIMEKEMRNERAAASAKS